MKRLILLLALATALSSTLEAANRGSVYVTTPRFIERLDLTAPGSLSEPIVKAFAVRGVKPALAKGRVAAVSQGQLTIPAPQGGVATWLNEPLLLEVMNGPLKGNTIDVQVALQEGDYVVTSPRITEDAIYTDVAVVIRRHWNLADIFGLANEAGLIAAAIPGAAETVTIANPDTDRAQTYFYSTTLGGWSNAASPTIANVGCIKPGSVIFLEVKTPVHRTVEFPSEIRYGKARVEVAPGVMVASQPLAGIPRHAPVPEAPLREGSAVATPSPATLVGSLGMSLDTEEALAGSVPVADGLPDEDSDDLESFFALSFDAVDEESSFLFLLTPESDFSVLEFNDSPHFFEQ